MTEATVQVSKPRWRVYPYGPWRAAFGRTLTYLDGSGQSDWNNQRLGSIAVTCAQWDDNWRSSPRPILQRWQPDQLNSLPGESGASVQCLHESPARFQSHTGIASTPGSSHPAKDTSRWQSSSLTRCCRRSALWLRPAEQSATFPPHSTCVCR